LEPKIFWDAAKAIEKGANEQIASYTRVTGIKFNYGISLAYVRYHPSEEGKNRFFEACYCTLPDKNILCRVVFRCYYQGILQGKKYWDVTCSILFYDTCGEVEEERVSYLKDEDAAKDMIILYAGRAALKISAYLLYLKSEEGTLARMREIIGDWRADFIKEVTNTVEGYIKERLKRARRLKSLRKFYVTYEFLEENKLFLKFNAEKTAGKFVVWLEGTLKSENIFNPQDVSFSYQVHRWGVEIQSFGESSAARYDPSYLQHDALTTYWKSLLEFSVAADKPLTLANMVAERVLDFLENFLGLSEDATSISITHGKTLYFFASCVMHLLSLFTRSNFSADTPKPKIHWKFFPPQTFDGRLVIPSGVPSERLPRKSQTLLEEKFTIHFVFVADTSMMLNVLIGRSWDEPLFKYVGRLMPADYERAKEVGKEIMKDFAKKLHEFFATD